MYSQIVKKFSFSIKSLLCVFFKKKKINGHIVIYLLNSIPEKDLKGLTAGFVHMCVWRVTEVLIKRGKCICTVSTIPRILAPI